MNTQFVRGDSIFTRINKISKQYDYLTEDIETDVIIVGGGVTGSILGYYLTMNNIKAVVLEKNLIAYGSTSITTSLLQYELDGTARELEEHTKLSNTIKAYKLGLLALSEIEKFTEEYGNKCDYIKRDTLFYTSKQCDVPEIEEEFEVRKSHGFKVKFLSEEESPFSFDLKAGVIGIDGGAELDPYKFTHHLLEVATSKGLKVFENTEVLDVNYMQDGVEVVTKYDKKVRGKIIVVATGYNTGLFTDRNFGTTTTAFNVATKPLSSLEGYENNVLIRDNGKPYNYLRTTTDKRIIIGGEDVRFLPDINNESIVNQKYLILEQRLKAMFPDIEDIEIEYKYCGAFTSTQDNLGFIGKDPNNEKLWFNLGYGANGILFAILGGMMLSKLYKGEKDENLYLFNVERFDN